MNNKVYYERVAAPIMASLPFQIRHPKDDRLIASFATRKAAEQSDVYRLTRQSKDASTPFYNLVVVN